MIWFLFSIVTALAVAAQDVVSKRGLRHTNEYLIAWASRFFALILLLPLLLIDGIPQIGDQFVLALVVSGILNVIVTILYLKAIKHSPLSLASPMLTMTPLFLLITSPLIIGELPGWLGIGGIVFIVVGSYFLNIKKIQSGFLGPFKALFKEKGVRYMLGVAAIWSITANFDKIGIQNSSVIFWPVAAYLVVAAILTPIMLVKARKDLYQIKERIGTILPIGLLWGVMIIFQMAAVNLTLVVYVISIKRTSAIFSVLGGILFFREKGLKERLLGAMFMMIGVILIAFD
ncbi:DMT family transporter [Patescibacteria group bacterium]|nr:DMT family transporter [Patescibacteria group bacterium]MBU0963604.1 DMT family transporter [Patescibacteria group bacterium]